MSRVQRSDARVAVGVQLELVEPYSPRTEAVWRQLEAAAGPIYFLSWGWVENWLACLPAGEAPQLAVLVDRGTPIAACFLRRRRLRRHHVIASRALFMNAVGDWAYDELCVEHNALLATGGAYLAQLIALLPGDWDELFLPALDAPTFDELARASLPSPMHVRVDRQVADYYVDLAKIRAKGYLPLLGSSTRAQLRKAQRLAPTAVLDVARTLDEAKAIYDELVVLHQRAWQQKGEKGAFADPWFDRFHRRLIARRFEHGEIQLVRLRTETETIGCLYNYVLSGRVLVYQTGINPDVDRNLKPGFFTHLFAVEHNAAEGHATYDFLGGDAQYKKSLGTDETKITWARVQKKQLVFALEDRARAWWREYRAKRESRESREDRSGER
jgi:CelD/BcsL family acetyltransferase involved in cellulose biosynthesis